MATSDRRTHVKYEFRHRTGYVIAPEDTEGRVSVRHSALAPPWSDADIHSHKVSEEYYFLFQGQLRLLVAGKEFTLQPREVLAVRPGVPHAVLGGEGPVEHFVLRFPAAADRQTLGSIPTNYDPEPGGAVREVQGDWGCRVPLSDPLYQNCWLFGVGQAHFLSELFCLAYLDFPDAESLAANRHTHRLHLHRESWEFYSVLRGEDVLRVEQELVTIHAGEILAVPAGTRHIQHAKGFPFEGITFRTPLLNDKEEFV